ncbi:hypothetical protein Ddye_004197 [Dipteronia dyeriana]|uniref:Prolamin-like domain-containing protein n=1 Tax=Dipteronia dyeriana TaxID=168575 RepID=A0AAE0CWX6_9ROSI|nr:hypothetical protein Ddye_004197 [Dipteronia dyeriana]
MGQVHPLGLGYLPPPSSSKPNTISMTQGWRLFFVLKLIKAKHNIHDFRFFASMMMKEVLAVVLLMMVSLISAASDIGYSYCTCSVDGRVVTGTIVTSPNGSGSICACPGPQQQPPENPPSHHHGGHYHRGRNQPSAPVVRNPPQPQHPAIQLPPIPYMNPRAQSCLQEFLDSNACMAQVDEAYRYKNLALIQPYCCHQFNALRQDCASTFFTYLNLPFFQNVFYEYCNRN